MATVSDQVYEPKEDCPYLKQLYKNRAENGGSPCESLSEGRAPLTRVKRRETEYLVGRTSTTDRWDETAYDQWSYRDEKKYNPEFDYVTLSKAAFEVVKQQRHNKVRSSRRYRREDDCSGQTLTASLFLDLKRADVGNVVRGDARQRV